MAAQAIVFACANPIPEILPWEAKEAGVKIIATGRSDFPNQVNNSLVFPGLSPGAHDIRARTITDDMAIAVAHELADYARETRDSRELDSPHDGRMGGVSAGGRRCRLTSSENPSGIQTGLYTSIRQHRIETLPVPQPLPF